MKSYDERLRLKNHFFKLGQGRIIDTGQTSYWQHLWQEPEDSNDIYELLTPFDIKTIRDQNRINFLTLIRVLSEKVVHIVAADTVLHDTHSLLNCTRFLTKLLPFLYELPEYVDDIENSLFWSASFDPVSMIARDAPTPLSKVNQFHSNPESTPAGDDSHSPILGLQLLRSTVRLLFVKGFTVDATAAKKTHTTLWEPGIGSNTPKYAPPNLIVDANRTEVLKFLLTLVSNSLYQLPSQIIYSGSKFLTLLVVAMPRVELLTLVCSLFNLLCRSSRAPTVENGLVHQNADLIDQRFLLVTYACQLLTLMIGYPLPSSENLTFLSELNVLSSPRPANLVRLYIGKLHKESELLLIYSSLMHILKLPLQKQAEDSGSFSLVKSSAMPSLWTTETLMLIWELLQCNKNFRSLVATRYSDELLVVLTYYLVTYHTSAAHTSMVRTCSYLILYMSSDPKLVELSYNPIKEMFYQSMPQAFQTNPRPVTTRDFLVTQMLLMIENTMVSNTSNKVPVAHPMSDLLMLTLVETLYNLFSPVSTRDLKPTNDDVKKMSNFNARGGLSYSTAWTMTQVLVKISSPEFLNQKPFNADLLALLVRAVCNAILKNPASSRLLLFSILKNEKVYDSVWTTVNSFERTEEKEEEDDQVTPKQVDDNDVDSRMGDVSFQDDSSISTSPEAEPQVPGSNGDSNRTSMASLVSEAQVPVPNLDYKAIEESLRSKPPTGMSDRAREKLPKNSPLKRTWGGKDALRVILTIVIPHLKEALQDLWNPVTGAKGDSWQIVKKIEQIDFEKIISRHKASINNDFLPETPFETLKFTWSHLSLGWYLSLLYGDIYNAINLVKDYTGGNNKIMKNITSSLASVSKITSSWTSFIKSSAASAPQVTDIERVNQWVQNSATSTNHWASTAIKLFRIETPSDGIFGRAPGTPGSMANHLVRRFSDFKINTNTRNSISSGLTTPVEEQEATFGRMPHRASISSLHSLNTLNRSRSNTPRNSISM